MRLAKPGIIIRQLDRRCDTTHAIRMPAVSLGSAERLEEGNGYQAPRVRKRGVACLVPFAVVFVADDMEEVSS